VLLRQKLLDGLASPLNPQPLDEEYFENLRKRARAIHPRSLYNGQTIGRTIIITKKRITVSGRPTFAKSRKL
jgi:hypothetical protein